MSNENHPKNAAVGLFHITWKASNWNYKRIDNKYRLFSYRMKKVRETLQMDYFRSHITDPTSLQTAFFMSYENHPSKAAHGLFHIKRNASNRNCGRMKNKTVLFSYRIKRIRGKLHMDYLIAHETDSRDVANGFIHVKWKPPKKRCTRTVSYHTKRIVSARTRTVYEE